MLLTRRMTWRESTPSRSWPDSPDIVEDAIVGGAEGLALAIDRGRGIVHRGVDLGRGAAVQRDVSEERLEPVVQGLARRQARSNGGFAVGSDPVGPVAHQRVDQVVARREMAIQRAGAHPRALGDLVQGSGGAALGEHLASRRDQLVVVATGVGPHGSRLILGDDGVGSDRTHNHTSLANRRHSPYSGGRTGVLLRSSVRHQLQRNRNHHHDYPHSRTTRPAAGDPRHHARAARPADARARRHRRERRAPPDQDRPRLLPRRTVVGSQCLHARLRRIAASRWTARRRLRTTSGLRDRTGPVRRGLVHRWACPDA